MIPISMFFGRFIIVIVVKEIIAFSHACLVDLIPTPLAPPPPERPKSCCQFVPADLEAATELSQQVQQLLQKGTGLLLEEVLL